MGSKPCMRTWERFQSGPCACHDAGSSPAGARLTPALNGTTCTAS